MRRDRKNVDALLAGPRIVAGVFGFAFAGIGLTVLISLWATPFGQFGSPPLFFRIFGSFIAIVFIAAGGSSLIGALTAGRLLDRFPVPTPEREAESGEVPVSSNSPLNYSCPKCGAQIGRQADVSPLGDVKCTFCNQWFNIHTPPTFD